MSHSVPTIGRRYPRSEWANTEPSGKRADHNAQTVRVEIETVKMKSRIQIKNKSHTNWSNNTFRFFRPRDGRLRCTTAMLGGAVAGILLALPAVARDDDDLKRVEHVLLISVDGMHQSDLALDLHTHPKSTLSAP